MIARTLSFYFAKRFMLAVIGVFAGVFFLVGIIDYIEMTRRVGDMANVSSLTAAEICTEYGAVRAGYLPPRMTASRTATVFVAVAALAAIGGVGWWLWLLTQGADQPAACTVECRAVRVRSRRSRPISGKTWVLA